jgi:DNA recombination protein RmuC
MLLIYLLIGLTVIMLIIAVFYLARNSNFKVFSDISYKLTNMQAEIQRIELAVKSEIATNRKEASTNATSERNELSIVLASFKNDLAESIQQFNTLQRDNFFALLDKQTEQNTDTSTRLDSMRQTLEKKISDMQQGNEQKLEQMRITVDEKLQQTLEARLGESFRLVSERLEAVHKGLGDMQQLATGVGDLKRVLSNVKTRGIIGEYQLANILEQTLTPEQYAKNVKTKEGSNAIVEFAIKFPGSNDKTVWMPVDSKFPKEDYELLVEAYDRADVFDIEQQRKAFTRGIRKSAQDICTRYIDPPNTTDFALMFLPFESLYAEVLRVPGLFESIRLDYKIIIAGPTTLSAIMSSLQMGFRTLAIERRSSEVWQLLGEIKTEFNNFSGMLDKAQKNIQTGLNQLEDVVGARTRAIQRRLKDVDTISDEQVKDMLPEVKSGELFSEEE